ncbi:MAG TPA: hypothetical protein VMW24_08375 [Sedimentisphaerales bacterium]|nr:hypothetical protein [Sedimentisphaerales bacterium]
MSNQKPIVLWSCDVKGWAYHNRVETMSKALPQYNHRVWIMSAVAPSLLKGLMAAADIIICQGIKVVERTLAAGADPKKILCRMDSIRIDHEGQYFDIFTKEAAVR